MDRPPPDPVKLLEHWMEWEKGDTTPGLCMVTGKPSKQRVIFARAY